MELLKKILECKDEEVNSIIEVAITEENKNAEKVEKLGFLDYGKTNSVFKGFIPLETRIKYANLNLEDYGMESTDFIYEFAQFIRKYNIKNKAALINSLEFFVNGYFGFPGKIDRETVFNDIAWKTTTTDEEYFNALKNNKLGDLKGTGAAQCTERGALVQQILSIFGIESYYCMGCVDLVDRQEGHCFNIAKGKDGYVLLDYSIPIAQYNENGGVIAYYPFMGTLTEEEFADFESNGVIKSFDDYYINGNQKKKTGTQRMYVVGEYKIEKVQEDENNKNM